MNLKEALDIVLSHLDETEWTYEDRGYDAVHCQSCGADTRDIDRDTNRIGNIPDHRPDCRMTEARKVLEEFSDTMESA